MTDNTNYTEGSMTKRIEEQTAKVPSGFFLTAALVAMGVSASLKCMKQPHTALFVGQWAAPLLLLGIYNKIVKLEGHDREDKA